MLSFFFEITKSSCFSVKIQYIIYPGLCWSVLDHTIVNTIVILNGWSVSLPVSLRDRDVSMVIQIDRCTLLIPKRKFVENTVEHHIVTWGSNPQPWGYKAVTLPLYQPFFVNGLQKKECMAFLDFCGYHTVLVCSLYCQSVIFYVIMKILLSYKWKHSVWGIVWRCVLSV